MGEVLAKTFEGEHKWVKNGKGETKIDSMFFPTTGEKVQDDKYDAEYKSMPTIIICNPNAMFY